MRGVFILVAALTACSKPTFVAAPAFSSAGTVVFWQNTEDPNDSAPRWLEHDGQDLLLGDYPIEPGGPVTALHYDCSAAALNLPGELVVQPGANRPWNVGPNQIFELEGDAFVEKQSLSSSTQGGLRNTNWQQPSLCEVRAGPNLFTPIILPSQDHLGLTVFERLDEGVFMAASNSINYFLNDSFEVDIVDAPPNLRAGYRGADNTLFVVDQAGVVFRGHPLTGFSEVSRGASIPERQSDIMTFQVELVGSPSGDEMYLATQVDMQVYTADQGWRSAVVHTSSIFGLGWLRPGTAIFASNGLVTLRSDGQFDATDLNADASFMSFLYGLGFVVSTADARVFVVAEDGRLEQLDVSEPELGTFLIPIRTMSDGGIVFGRVRQTLTQVAVWYPDTGLCQGSDEIPATGVGYVEVVDDSVVIATQSAFGRNDSFLLLRFDRQSAARRCGRRPL